MKRLVVVLAAALVGCTTASASESVVLDEFSVQVPLVESGRSELTVTNAGEFPHTLVISDDAGRVIVATEPIEPGGELSVPVDLAEGRYQFSCRIVVERPDGGISDHFELGMVAELDL